MNHSLINTVQYSFVEMSASLELISCFDCTILAMNYKDTVSVYSFHLETIYYRETVRQLSFLKNAMEQCTSEASSYGVI